MGIDAVIQVGVDVSSSEEAVRIAHDGRRSRPRSPHPNEAPYRGGAGQQALEQAWDRIAQLAADDTVGPSAKPGWTSSAPMRSGRAAQEGSFRRHIQLARTWTKTLVIHDRDAHADILRIMDEEGRRTGS